ncbi:MAG TPA: UDP-2,3-diacylglucosamine diphosphatase [Patescibacteria group bacterium]|nr:UDP-2,3-diacylglucosamine diphosphatase [Patescibacteria group bacterium]
MSTLLISDLHLDADRPAVTALFLDWLRRDAIDANALYILGDLFEAYIGDDDDAPLIATVAEALRALVDAGVPVSFVHGNRDFLVGPAFAQRAGVTLLPESGVVDLHGTPTLLLHGDTLCLDDVAYQRIRVQLRHPDWQRQFLAQPLAARRAFAAQARADSAKHTGSMDRAIMDVTASAVEAALDAAGVRRMIHGHTHRPAVHDLGDRRQRIVLGDWYEHGSVLRVDGHDLTLATLPLPA